MSTSAWLTLEQLKEIIEDENKTNLGAREVQQQVDGEEVLNSDNSIPVLTTVLNTINNKFEPECLDEVVRLLHAHSIRQSTEVRVPVYKYSIPGLSGTRLGEQQVWAISFIMRR